MTAEWGWYVGFDECFYQYGPYESKDDAIEVNKDDFVGMDLFIVEAKKEPIALSDFIDIERFIYVADTNATEQHTTGEGVDCLFDISKEHEDDLKARIKKACDEWQSANNIVFYPEIFTNTRNEDVIPIKDVEVAETEQ